MRKRELSLLNVLFCMLVIFIHLASYPLGGYEKGSMAYSGVLFMWRLSSFVVQGFVFLSGLKMFLPGKEKPYFKMLFGKVKGIIVPYTFWFAVYYVFYMIIADYPLNIGFILKHFIMGSLAPHTYFVPLIMQFFILYPVFKLAVKKVNPIVAISLSVLISLFCENCLPVILYNKNISFIYNDRLFTTYLSYWVVGCFVGANYEKVTEFMKKHLLVIPWLLLTTVSVVFTYINYNIKYLSYYNVIHFLYCFASVFFWFNLFVKTKEKSLMKIRLLSEIDKVSYTIYLCHMLFVFITAYLFTEILGIQSNILLFVSMTVTVYPASVLTSYAVSKIRQALSPKL